MVKCDICDQEFANSEEIKAHKEQDHPRGDDGNKPAMGEEMQRPESEMPEPAEQPNR